MTIDFGAALRQQDGGACPPLDEGPEGFGGEHEGGPWSASEIASMQRGASLAPADPYDLEPVRARLKPFEDHLVAVNAQASALEVVDEASNQAAAETLATAKKLVKSLEDARKGIIGDADGFVRAVNNLAKGVRDKLEAISRVLSPKMGRYAALQEQKRREEEARRRKEAEELQAKINAEAKKTGTEPVKVEAAAVPEPQGPVRTAAGTVQTRKVWTFEITDAAQVPREYMAIDETRIRQAVAAGIRQIAGVNIYQDTKVAVRAA
jgi:hypothetical protein